MPTARCCHPCPLPNQFRAIGVRFRHLPRTPPAADPISHRTSSGLHRRNQRDSTRRAGLAVDTPPHSLPPRRRPLHHCEHLQSRAATPTHPPPTSGIPTDAPAQPTPRHIQNGAYRATEPSHWYDHMSLCVSCVFTVGHAEIGIGSGGGRVRGWDSRSRQ